MAQEKDNVLLNISLALISAALLFINYRNPGILAFFIFAPIFHVAISSRRFINASRYVFLFSLVFFPAFRDMTRASRMAFPTFLLLFLAFFLFNSIISYLIHITEIRFRRFNGGPVKKALLSSALVTLFLYLVLIIFPPFNIFNPAVSFHDAEMVLYFLGPFPICFLIIFSNIFLAYSFFSKKKLIDYSLVLLLSAAFILATNALFPSPHQDGSLAVGVVQPGKIPGEQNANISLNLAIYAQETRELLDSGEKIDFVAWPEYAFYEFLDDNTSFREELLDLSEELGIPILLGAQKRISAEVDALSYNAVYVLYPNRTADYFLAEEPYPFDTTTAPSDSRKPLWQYASARIALLSCNEETRFDMIRRYNREEANLFLVFSNNNFPGKVKEMALSHASLQAAASQRYFLRVTKTGYTALIDAEGDIASSLPPDIRASGVFKVPMIWKRTPYSYYGDYPVFAILLCLALFLPYIQFRSRR